MSLICSTSIEHLPTEVLQIIFAYYLPVKQLMKIRQVCSLWRDFIDGLAGSYYWRRNSKRDFSDVYNIAYHKAGKGKQWFNIYRSLTLWAQLAHAKEIRKEFVVVDDSDDEDEGINRMQVLQDGVVVVVLTNKVIYYDIDTMETRQPTRSYSTGITGLKLIIHDYEENQHIIQFNFYKYRFRNLLAVIFKTVDNPDYKINATFHDVGVSLLSNEEIFFVKYRENKIYTCKLIDGEVKTTKLAEPKEEIICFGYTDQLNYITKQGNIYSLVNGNESFCCSVKNSKNILDQLYKYNLLKTFDRDADEIQSWYERQHYHEDMGPFLEFLISIYNIKVYGKVVLVCEEYTNFYIYYDPFINGEFDIWNSQPVKKYSFGDCKVEHFIVDVDVLEKVDGHTVLVALLDKIIALDFIHPLPKLK